MRHVTSLFDLTDEEVQAVLDRSIQLKKDFKAGKRESLLPGYVIGLLFEKPSLRTRVSFETGVRHLGGGSLFLGDDVGWGKRESPEDFSKVLSRFVDAIVCRSNSHEMVETLAKYSSCPVVNGLTDRFHPCQALADLLTVSEMPGGLKDKKIAYVGDANNVARSLLIGCAKLNVPCAIAAPEGYQFEQELIDRINNDYPKFEWTQTADPVEAVKDAAAVYTDVWVSMGQEKETEIRKQAFADYQVTGELMGHAEKDAIFLHCLPAHRGLEVSADVIDGEQSRIYDQAENRMHAQKGLLVWLLHDLQR